MDPKVLFEKINQELLIFIPNQDRRENLNVFLTVWATTCLKKPELVLGLM